MSSKSILAVFDTYQRARLAFTQNMSNAANRSVYTDCLKQCDALELLQPLLKDPSIKVQQRAAMAIGKLANSSVEAAKDIIRMRILEFLLEDIDTKSNYYKKSSMFTIKSVAKYSEEMAEKAVGAGVIEGILLCLEDFDTTVKEAAVLALGTIAKHNTNLAEACISSGAIPMLKLCLQEPEIGIKQITAATMGNIVRHDTNLALALCDAGCVPHLVRSLCNPSVGLKCQLLCTLGHIVKHSMILAEVVVESDVIPDVLLHLGHPDANVRKNAANLLAEITKHHVQMAELVVNSGCIGALLQMIATAEGDEIFPAILALGYIASQSESIALHVINAKAIEILAPLFNKITQDEILAALVWTVGEIGKHSPNHTLPLAKHSIFNKLLELYLNEISSEDLKKKCRIALKQSVRKCFHTPSLDQLLQTAPPEILKFVLGQYTQILPTDPKARRLFVMTGALKKVQQILAEPGSSTMEFINIINHCFPEEIIKYYTPSYSEELMRAVEKFKPAIPPVFAYDHDEPEEIDLMNTFNRPQKPEIC